MTYQIWIENSDQSFSCSDRQNVLNAMEQLGRRGIPVGCRGGGCGVCKVQVLEGDYRTDKMSKACVSEQEQAEGQALACKLYAAGDLRLKVIGKMRRALDARAVVL
jgi:ferredoxin